MTGLADRVEELAERLPDGVGPSADQPVRAGADGGIEVEPYRQIGEDGTEGVEGSGIWVMTGVAGRFAAEPLRTVSAAPRSASVTEVPVGIRLWSTSQSRSALLLERDSSSTCGS